MRKIRIGLIGVGGIMHEVHIPGYQKLDNVEITAICDISDAALKKTAEKFNLGSDRCFYDYKELIDSGLVDAVDIATPNDSHCAIAEYALDKGLPVSVEKPIGLNFDEAKSLARKAQKTGLPVFVCFSWRYRDFPRYMKYLIDKGEVGEIYHINLKSLKNSGLWKGRRLEWRFQKEKAGSGVLCDLGSHMFDMVRFFGQEFKSVYCDSGIIIKKRQKLNSEEWADVTTDDWSYITCKLESGIGASIFVSRCFTSEDVRIELEVVGSKGTLLFTHYNNKSALLACTGENVKTRTFVELTVPQEVIVGSQSEAFVNMILGKKDGYTATIEEGLKSQAAVDAALLSSIYGRAVTIDEMFKD